MNLDSTETNLAILALVLLLLCVASLVERWQDRRRIRREARKQRLYWRLRDADTDHHHFANPTLRPWSGWKR